MSAADIPDRTRPRIHHVSCSRMSDNTDEDVERVAVMARKVAAFARKLGFGVSYDNVDEGEIGDEVRHD